MTTRNRAKRPAVKAYIAWGFEQLLSLDPAGRRSFMYPGVYSFLKRRYRNRHKASSALVVLTRIGAITSLQYSGQAGGQRWFRIKRMRLKAVDKEFRRVLHKNMSPAIRRPRLIKQAALRHAIYPKRHRVPRLSGPQLLRQLLRHSGLPLSPQDVERIEIHFFLRDNRSSRTP